MITLAAVMTTVAHFVLGLQSTVTAGMFAGSLTNTPALAGLLDTIGAYAPPSQLDTMLAEPVVGHSVAYPVGVLGMLVAIALMQRVRKIDYQKDINRLRNLNVVEKEIYNRTVCVTNPSATGVSIREMREQTDLTVLFGRLKRGDTVHLVDGQTQLELEDLVSVIGTPGDVDIAVNRLGDLTDEHLELDRTQYDFRRVFVSNPQIAGMKLSELQTQPAVLGFSTE